MAMDADVLLQKTKEFFFLLFQEDSFFILAADKSVSDDALHSKTFLPYTAAITPEGESQYLRLFSHKDAAMQYLSELKLPEKNCVPISSLETVQLAKFWFLRGVRGFVLNDGSPWVAISFPDYLQMVFQNLLEAPEMYRQEYVDFILAQPPLSDGELDFHSVQYVNLDFEPDDNPTEQYALLPVQVKPEENKTKWHLKDCFQNIKLFWKHKKTPRHKSGKAASSHKKSYKKLLLPVGLGIALCVPLGIAGISVLNTRNFSAALENHDFVKAAAIYEKNTGSTYFIKTADGKIIESIEQMITDYAGGRIPIENVRAQLEDYQQFAGLQDEFAVYTEQVSRLEYSKSAYLSGRACFEQGNYLQGLSVWTLVVPDDCYYQDVTNAVRQNEKVYKTQGLLQCEKYKESSQTEKYQKGLALLYRWFPHDSSLQDPDIQAPVFVDEDDPIKIEDISVSMPNPNMGRDLHIRWTNTSGKPISSITFLVEAIDAFGNPAKCNRGGYSLYQAAADGPFANGEGMAENSYWQSAWYNSVIEDANLLGISINYADGSSEEISEPAALEALKSKGGK